MVSGTTKAPLRAPSGARPETDHFLVFGSKNWKKAVMASSADCPNGPHIWPTAA